MTTKRKAEAVSEGEDEKEKEGEDDDNHDKESVDSLDAPTQPMPGAQEDVKHEQNEVEQVAKGEGRQWGMISGKGY